jgi:hypothetical protein
MEREDDNLCMMEGVEFGNNNIKSTYWECRLRIIDQRIANFATRPGYSMFYKIEMQKLRIIIQERAKTEIEKLEKQAENSFEEKEHTFCILVSNKEARIDTNSNSENISYLKCREIMESKRVKEKGNIVFSNEEFI